MRLYRAGESLNESSLMMLRPLWRKIAIFQRPIEDADINGIFRQDASELISQYLCLSQLLATEDTRWERCFTPVEYPDR